MRAIGGTMDTARFRDIISETPWMIELLRNSITSKDYGYSDEEKGGLTFGPKSPGNDGMLLFADTEAGALGALANYCVNTGSIPPVPLNCFWWPGGRCRGLSVHEPDSLPNVWRVVFHLKAYAPEVLATEGVEEYLSAVLDIRGITKVMFPDRDVEWLNIGEAINFTGRDRRTVYRWIEGGGISYIDDDWGRLYSKDDLNAKMALIYANQIRNSQEMRRKAAEKSSPYMSPDVL